MVSYQSGGEVLQPGARVVFSGRITVDNELVPQGEKLRELCSEWGWCIRPRCRKPAVTR